MKEILESDIHYLLWITNRMDQFKEFPDIFEIYHKASIRTLESMKKFYEEKNYEQV